MSRKGEWKLQANCRGMDVNKFFDYYEESNAVQLEVDEICANCRVQSQCEMYGERTGSEGGVFGRKYFKVATKEKVLT